MNRGDYVGEKKRGKALGIYRWRHNVVLIAKFLLISLILFPGTVGNQGPFPSRLLSLFRPPRGRF